MIQDLRIYFLDPNLSKWRDIVWTETIVHLEEGPLFELSQRTREDRERIEGNQFCTAQL